MTLKDAAVEWVHWEGAASVPDLSDLLRTEGYRPRATSLDQLDEQYEHIQRFGNLLISTSPHTPSVAAFAALKELGINEGPDLVGGIRRSLGNGRLVRAVGRAHAAEQIVEILSNTELGMVETGVLDDDKRAVEILRERPGGVAGRTELQVLIDTDPRIATRNFNLGYSPLLEMVASGVYGIRGAPIDLEAIARIRPTGRSPWAPWGRLDRTRAWVQVKSRGQSLRARIPNDFLDVLATERQPLVSLTGSPLGSLWVDHHDIAVEWTHPQPPEWEGEQRNAVLEFDLVDRYARLLAGASTTADQDPRFVDGCALHNGRWRAVLEIDDTLASTHACPIPAAIDGIPELHEGQAVTIPSNLGDLTFTREPHAIRIRFAPDTHLVPGGFLRLDIDRGRCAATNVPTAATPSDEITFTVGIFASNEPQWRRIGAALGLSNANQDEVARRFADRERFDLSQLVRNTPNLTTPSTQSQLSSDSFHAEDGQLIHEHLAGLRYARRSAGSGPLGLHWKSVPDPHPDGDWARITHTILRAWAAGASQPIHLERSSAGWELPDDPKSSLLAALEVAGRSSGDLPTPMPSGEAQVPLTAFGARHALATADRAITTLVISAHGWTINPSEETKPHATPLRALTNFSARAD